MSAASRSTRRRKSFTVSEYVDIDVSAEDLEAEGWVYVGDSAEPGFQTMATLTTNDAITVVREWHDRKHPTAWPWCEQEPCRDLR